MSTSSPKKKTIDLQANTSTPHGATIRLTVEYRIRPPTPAEPGPIYEQVKMQKVVDVNMGTSGQYQQQANYAYGSEKDTTQKYSQFERTHDATQAYLTSTDFNKEDDIFVPEKIIEHISEDEKSTSSEEVVFEEWTEEFHCRRTDEYDPNTNKLIKSTIDETSDRIKGDVTKEEYKEKNTRIKGHKSYDVVKEVYRRVPTHIYEEIIQPPPPSSISQDRQWTSEDVYTTEIVHDPNLAKELESTAQQFDSLTRYDRGRLSQYSPIPSTTQPTVSTYPLTRYDRTSNVATPTLHYADKRKQEQEEEQFFSEEYHVEYQTPTKREGISREDLTDTYITTDQSSPSSRDSDWRNKLKQIYTPSSDDNQYKNQIAGNYLAQRVPIIPSNLQQRFKEVQIKIPGLDKTPPQQRKFEPSPPSRHTVKDVLVSVARGSSPEKQYHDENEQKKKRMFFADLETPKKIISTSQTDRSTFSRVGELKNAFEITTSGSTKDETSKYKTSTTTGLTEQRRRIFEEQEQANKEWIRRPVNEFRTNERRVSETHTGPSLVNDRISRFESSIVRTTPPQTSVDIRFKNKKMTSSIDSDLSGPTQPIYQSTPKSIKQKYDEYAGHESGDELSDPKQNYGARRHTSKTRLRDFSQSTSQPIDTTHTVQRTISKFNETNMENILAHVPTSKGKGILIELSPHTHQSPSKSNLTSDSGVFDYSTTTSHQLRTSSPSWRNNVSTSIIDDTTRSRDNGVYIDSTITGSPYARRQISDADQTTIQNVDDSISRSTYRYDRELFPNQQQQQQQQQQRTVRRQITTSPPTDYENLTSYHSRVDTQGKVPIITQSRSTKPLVIDEIETVETETLVECQVQRTNEVKETTKTERLVSPISSPKKILTTISRSSAETTPTKRVLLNERPQYYEVTRQETRFQPIQRNHSQDDLLHRPASRSYNTGSHTMQITSLSPTNQIKFGKHSPNEIIAVVRVPELSNAPIRHGTSESYLYEKTKQEEERPRLHYQRVNATSYRPPSITQTYQPQQSRSRIGQFEATNNYSSPINVPTRSASYHSTLHEHNQQQKYQPSHSQTRHHTGSLGNIFGSNIDFEIEIEKRPPQQPEQPTRIFLDQSSRAIVTTSKDGRVSVQNVAAYPGNTVIINSDYHSSDRSLNRSSGYFSSDEPRSQGHTTNYSSDEPSSGVNQYSYSTSSPIRRYTTNEQISTKHPSQYHFGQVNEIVQHYSQPSSNFNEAIDQIDALYNNLDVQTNNQRSYDFSKLNRRKQLKQNPNEYSQRYTSTGFQQQTTSDNNQNQTSSLTNLIMSTPIRPSQSLSSSGVLADYGTPGSISPNSAYGSTQNMILQQNRLNEQAQLVQRNRTSVKQKSAAKNRNGQYSDEDEDNDSPLSDNGRLQSSSRAYNFNNYHQ